MSEFYDETSLEFNLSGETITALLVVLVLAIFAVIIGIKAKKQDPMKPSKGILFIAEWAVEFLDNFVADMMGKGFENFGGILFGVLPLIFLCFTSGILGLPSPINSLAVPLTFGLVTFSFIHFTAMRYNKLHYFSRFIDPIPLFLPINLISMWAPLISITMRMFGNGLVGWVLMTLVNWALGNVSASIFSFLPSGLNSIFLAPIVTPVLHAYFDLVSGFIQTLVYTFLTVLLIAQEKPSEEEELVLEIPLRKEETL